MVYRTYGNREMNNMDSGNMGNNGYGNNGYGNDLGSCNRVNMLSPYCIREPQKCKQFAEDCIQLAREGSSKLLFQPNISSLLY